MSRYYYRPWKDETLVSALHFLRCRIIREEQDGQEHVEALLRQLGVEPDTLPMPEKRPKHFKRGHLRQAILEALRSGPLTGAEIAQEVGGGLEPKAAYKRTYQALHKMKVAGMVRNEGGVWWLQF